jgi:hypothetical protein
VSGLSERERIERARAVKATRIADECQAHRIDAATAERLDQQGRDAIAGLARQRTPSETTWAEVVHRLRGRERER